MITVSKLKQRLTQAREEDAEVLDNLRALRGEQYVATLVVAVDAMASHVTLLRMIRPPFDQLLRPMVSEVDGELQLHLAEQLQVDPEQFTTDVLMVVERRVSRVDGLLS